MTKTKNSKFSNTGIIFELLTRQLTADTLSGKDSPAIKIIKKYFYKSELLKEYKLYQSLISTKNLSEGKAETLLDTVLDISTKLNRKLLRSEKYNLIKEIKDNYNIEEFFKAKISNYTQYAAIYNLIETKNTKEFVNPSNIFKNKVTILEHISKDKVKIETDEQVILDEYSKLTKGERILTYKILLEKFNEKYSDLSNQQKQVLKEYINNISNTVNLREFVNDKYSRIKGELQILVKNVDDQTTKIKLTEIIDIIKPIDKNQNIKDENIVSLLQYYQLIYELKSVK
jgi:hypothetical protein